MQNAHHLAVERTARYFTDREPSRNIRDVWFVCHGYGQLASDFIREFECIGSTSRLIVAPEALSRFYIADKGGFHGPDAKIGATWMTREDREVEIADYIGYLDRLYDAIFEVVPREEARVTVEGNRKKPKGTSSSPAVTFFDFLPIA